MAYKYPVFRNLREDECLTTDDIFAKAFTEGFRPSKYRRAMVVTIAKQEANTDYIPFTFSLTVCRAYHQPGRRVAVIDLTDLTEGTDDGYYDNRLPSRTEKRLKIQAASVNYQPQSGYFSKASRYAQEKYENGIIHGSAEGEIYRSIPKERFFILTDEEFQEACQYIDEHCNGSRNEKNLMFFDYILARHHFGE